MATKQNLADRLNTLQDINGDFDEDFDEIVSNTCVPTGENKVVRLPISCLVDYADKKFEQIAGRPQPFKFYNKKDLESLANSIRENGVIQPIIVRPLSNGQYQVVAGRNRRKASILCGLTEIPAIIKENLDDIGAAMFMLDTNLEQRPGLCYSEKAYAYKMRLDLQNCQGRRTDIKVDTLEEIGRNNHDSRRTVAYLIRLTFLLPELLDMVDHGKIGFKVAVSISYLSKETQHILLKEILPDGIKLRVDQVNEVRQLDKSGQISLKAIKDIFVKSQQYKTQKITLHLPQMQEYAKLINNEKEIEKLFLEFLQSYQAACTN